MPACSACSCPARCAAQKSTRLTRMEVLETLAQADASVAWCVEIGSSVAWMLSGLLREDVAREMLCRDAYAIAGAAVTHSGGQATPVHGGYRVTGRWVWRTGCTHTSWLGGGCTVMEADRPCLHPDGTPVLRSVVLPTSEVEIIDTYRSTGLRGSGSHDYAVRDLFVPEEHSSGCRPKHRSSQARCLPSSASFSRRRPRSPSVLRARRSMRWSAWPPIKGHPARRRSSASKPWSRRRSRVPKPWWTPAQLRTMVEEQVLGSSRQHELDPGVRRSFSAAGRAGFDARRRQYAVLSPPARRARRAPTPARRRRSRAARGRR